MLKIKKKNHCSTHYPECYFQKYKSYPVTLLLKTLYWIAIALGINFKLFPMAYKTL